jgi:fatty-acyl-CoA synthase
MPALGPAALAMLRRAGLLRPTRPDRMLAAGLALARWGLTPASAYGVAAARWPDRLAVVDERERLSYAELDRRTNAVAHGLSALGVQDGGTVALLARNSAAFVVAEVAAAKVGADVVYLNTGFGSRQLAAALTGASVVVCDQEFLPAVRDAAPGLRRVLAWRDGGGRATRTPTLDDLASGDDGPPPPLAREGRQIILTSGTTGDPRGAPHGAPPPLAGVSVLVSLLTAVPLRGGTTVVLPTPAFHAWGYLNLTLVALLGSTAVLPHRFDPADTLRQVEEHRAGGLVVVPAMLHRLLEVPAGRHDTSSLDIVVVSGAALPVELATRAERRFGPVLYDLYGSTEAGYVSVASPADRRAAPGTVGRPLPGVQLRLLDADGREVPRGQPGRVFVHGALTFAGYQDGGDAQQVDGLVATGDVGRLDAGGRLFVEGRTDEMVVTGGENVFPAVVEAALAEHPAVAEVAVAGVPDETYGARLVAYVVRNSEVSADELRAHASTRLATYQVPRGIVFLDALPRNETGKVLKRLLVGGAG